jgi:hypothetical protein
MRVFENRVLRRIFGQKRDEMIGGWRKLHIEELHNLYSSPSIVTKIKSRRMGRVCSTHGAEKCIEDFSGNGRRKETTRNT